MSSTFFGLEVARSGLSINQVVLDTIAHNVSNAGTDGYSRQRVVLSTNSPYCLPGMNNSTSPGQVGTGVQIQQIQRLRDSFIDEQYRKESKYLGYYQSTQKALEQMESIYNEPSDTAIRASLDSFWQGLQDLNVKPDDEPTRTALRQKALQLTDALNHTYTQLSDLRKSNDAEIDDEVSDINAIAKEISDLNDNIRRVEAGGNNQANDYRDRRDLLLDELSQHVGIQAEEDSLGAVSVYINGKALVTPTSYTEMAVKKVTDPIDPTNQIRQVVWSDTNKEVNLNQGSLQGLIDNRDITIKNSMDQLNQLASTLANKINEVHRAGVGSDGSYGLDFFVASDGKTDGLTPPQKYVITAQNITVSKYIMDSVKYIAAGTPSTAVPTTNLIVYPATVPTTTVPATGDGTNALKLANVQHNYYNIGSSNTTIGDYYSACISQLGVASKTASDSLDNKKILLDNLETRRQSVSGVNEDDEMADMVKFQHGYSAAARVITTIDAMLDTLINRMGVS